MKKKNGRGKSGAWRSRQNSDQFVKKARAEGFRARSAFKLEQIDQKYRLIRPTTRLVDLGSSPGSWCQYAVKRINASDHVLAVDLLSMQPVSGVRFIQGDFTDQDIVELVKQSLGAEPIDLVLSDMAPNITGIRATDQARAALLQESILEFCRIVLKPGGALLTKIFEGEAALAMRSEMKNLFSQFQAIKPDASRAESTEIYLLGRGYRGTTQ